MKKKLVIITPIILIVVFSSFLLINNNNKNEVVMNEKNAPTNNNFLSIMLETEAGSGEYQESTFNGWPGEGYIFNEQMSTCENGSELSWDEELGAVTLSTGIADKCYVYFDVYAPTFAEYIISNVYVEDGVNDLYQHDGVGTYTNADQEAGDNSYRYAGANPNNYVCFGSEESTCSEDNLYRIIGVFDDEVKLIKADYPTINQTGTEGSYFNIYSISWTTSNFYKGNVDLSQIATYYWYDYRGEVSNSWGESQLNTMHLNQNYLNNFGNTWSSLIANHTWKVGGMNANDLYTVKQYYDIEIGANSNNTTINEKIGLMYVSDYGYAASPTNWTTAMSSYSNAISSNWINMGLNEWTISMRLNSSDTAFSLFDSGGIYYGFLKYSALNSDFAIRPCFYLTSDTRYDSGSGTKSDPFRIVV